MSDEKSKYFDPLAVLVAQGESVRAAAAAVGASESAAYRVAKKPEFKAAVNGLRSEVVTESIGKLGNACVSAVETIIELMNTAEDERIRLRAATSILERFEKLSDHHELRERIEALEAIRDDTENTA